LREEEYLKQIKEVVCLLESQERMVTMFAVQKIIKRDLYRLITQYPQINALWREMVFTGRSTLPQRTRRVEREEELLDQVQRIIKQLESQGEPITITTISKLMGIATKSLRSYHRIALLLDSPALVRRASNYPQKIVVISSVTVA